jgi:hypothetical protein
MMNDTSVHRHTWDQIPWVVNGTVPDTEREALEAHLAGCADCRAELEFQRRIAASLEAGSVCELDSQQSWQQLRARIDATGRSERTRHGQRRSRGALSGKWVPWLVAAMVVQAIGLGALGTVLWSKPGAPIAAGTSYRTLSAQEPAPRSATLRVVFAPDMNVGDMQALLMAAGLQVQSGPSSAGVWSLEPARDSNRSATQSALRELRDSPEVRFAEVIGTSP